MRLRSARQSQLSTAFAIATMRGLVFWFAALVREMDFGLVWQGFRLRLPDRTL